jgi:hypothetical protein
MVFGKMMTSYGIKSGLYSDVLGSQNKTTETHSTAWVLP